jgi:hypothetical protein
MARASKYASLLLVCVSLTGLSFSRIGTVHADEELNRSIYVPVEFNLSDEFSHAVLLKGDAALRPLPGQQVFQFTYYPSLHRLVPETQQFHIKAFREDGSSVVVGLVVTPSAVYIGERCIQLDMQRMLKLMRKRVDYRYEPVKLKIACGEATAKAEGTVGETANP